MAQPYVRDAYHRQTKPWRTNNHRPEGQLAGIELEIEHPNHYQNILEALPATDNVNLRPATEVDGSLNHHCGVEIIFPPFRYSQLRNGNSFFRRSLKALEDAGCVPSTNCGMHVNINTTDWTTAQRALFVTMNHALPANFLKRVGGRNLNGYCGQSTYWREYAIGTVINAFRNSHNTVASPRDNRIELRFPRATTDTKEVQKVIDYAHFLELFVKSMQYSYLQTLHNILEINSGIGEQSAVLEKFRKFVWDQEPSAARTRMLRLFKSE